MKALKIEHLTILFSLGYKRINGSHLGTWYNGEFYLTPSFHNGSWFFEQRTVKGTLANPGNTIEHLIH